MINIAHEKVETKPPINKYNSEKNKNNKLNYQRNIINKKNEKFDNGECLDCSEHDNLLDNKSSDLVTETMFNKMEETKYHHGTKNDCNQNIIEPNSPSYQQLCSMINDLENNLPHKQEIVSVTTCYLPTENHSIATDIKYLEQTLPEKDNSDGPCAMVNSTYDDIMKFLGTLEQNCSSQECQINSEQLSNYLSTNVNNIETFISRNQTEINQTDIIKDDLATALLKLEERNATLKLLKEELKSERKLACDKLEDEKRNHSNELKIQKTKYQNVIRRHQKFIEQLIDEKKQLSNKCNDLGQTIKEMEIKQQREIKVAIERHAVEIQRAKELCQASEKIRRERWLELKTSKIKEMTVKGLEPELRNMIDQHQKEIQDIRSGHMKELQDVELRAIRRSNQQLEQLRIELTASHDKILLSEKEALRLRYEEKFNEQETLIQTQQRKYFEDLQQERKKFTDEQTKRDIDRDMNIQEVTSQFHDKIEALIRQFEMEKKTLRETIEEEREMWMENYKRQQMSKFEMAEVRIREDSNRERDRQIELAISRLEKETRDIKINLQLTFDNKLKCLKDKYETELTVLKKNEKSMREKFMLTQEKLDSLENEFQRVESKLGQCQVDLNEANRLVDKTIKERDHAKKLARQEIECEKRELEEKISSLYREITQIHSNKESHMAQLYSRIKLIITQKDIAIKNISKEANDIKDKCDHLEKLLDQQRKEYLLKNL